MSAPKLILYFDIISPFGYMTFYVIRNSSVFKQCEVTYVPVLLGGIMKACGNTAPLFIKNKGAWIEKERLRWARRFNIPMNERIPEGFPVPTLQLMRAITALSLSSPKEVPEVAAAMYKAFFVDLETIHTSEGVLRVFEKVIGRAEARAVVERSKTDEVKRLLSTNTDEALANGCFGLPYISATNAEGKKESYWGFDHLGQVLDHLGLQGDEAGTSRDRGWRAML